MTMTDLQKDQAVYQAMCEIANQVFNETMEMEENPRTLLKQYGGFITLSDLCKPNHEFAKAFFKFACETASGKEIHEVSVDTFSCSFLGLQVFDLLKYWKSLARIKAEQYFFYEEKPENVFVGSVEVSIEDSANAKLITYHAAKDELRPVMNYVYAEVNAIEQTINFVASDGHTLAVISNNPSRIFNVENSERVYDAVFSVSDWKRICDFAKKNKQKVTFDIYEKKDSCLESFDTFIVHLGDVTLRSHNDDCMRFPNWRSVIPKYDVLIHRFSIVPEEVKAAQDWVKNLGRCDIHHVNISFYRGSDLVYFDFEDFDFSKSKTATFHLTRPSDTTIGIAYNVTRLQKIKFTGFNIQNEERASIVNCEEADIMLVMPVLDSGGYVRDVENREVVEETVMQEEETAMVIELQEAA